MSVAVLRHLMYCYFCAKYLCRRCLSCRSWAITETDVTASAYYDWQSRAKYYVPDMGSGLHEMSLQELSRPCECLIVHIALRLLWHSCVGNVIWKTLPVSILRDRDRSLWSRKLPIRGR